jgi:hypothetical protein
MFTYAITFWADGLAQRVEVTRDSREVARLVRMGRAALMASPNPTSEWRIGVVKLFSRLTTGEVFTIYTIEGGKLALQVEVEFSLEVPVL